MTIFETLQAAHLTLLDQLEAGSAAGTAAAPQPDIETVRAYIERVRTGAAHVSAPRERDQLRANLNFWGAYLYDHTQTYPETSLPPAQRTIEPPPAPWWQGYRDLLANVVSYRGAQAQTEPEPWWRNPYALVSVLAGILVILLLVWMGAKMAENFVQTTPPVTITVTAPATLTHTPDAPPTATSTPRSTVGITDTPTPRPSPTPVRRTPTPTPTPEVAPTIIVPNLTPPPLRPQVVAVLEAAPAACDTRTLEVRVDEGALKILGERGVSAQLSTFGGQLLASNTLNSQRETITFGSAILTRHGGSALLRLSRAEGDLTTTDVIIDFAGDCSRNALRVSYQLAEAPTVVEKPQTSTSLTLDWELLTWGPSPSGDAWVAQLRLLVKSTDEAAIFWLDGRQLEGDVITITGAPCEIARRAVGVSSGGEVVLRELALLSPYCP